ncbi:hypothetical protein Tco_0363528 [Tanacetum coccineum]
MGYCIPGTLTSPLPAANSRQLKSLKFSRYTLSASLEKNHIPLIGKKVNKVARRLVRISTAEGKWQGNWNADYNFTLRDLQLDDLVEVGDPKNARVLVSLTIHRALGFQSTEQLTHHSPESVATALCLTAERLLPTSMYGFSRLPALVIYVKPGCEADLDSLIQDTIRLNTSVNETCSDFCEKSELGLKQISKANTPSVDKRWSKLLELKNLYQ